MYDKTGQHDPRNRVRNSTARIAYRMLGARLESDTFSSWTIEARYLANRKSSGVSFRTSFVDIYPDVRNQSFNTSMHAFVDDCKNCYFDLVGYQSTLINLERVVPFLQTPAVRSRYRD